MKMRSYVGAICDEAHQRIGRQQRQAQNERILNSLQTVLFLASVDDKEEDGGSWGWPRQLIFDGCALRVELRGYCVLRDILVMRGQWVAHQTERTDPDPGTNINRAVELVRVHPAITLHARSAAQHSRIWVQNSSARLFASDGLILEQWRVALFFQGGIDGSNGNNKPGRFLDRGLVGEGDQSIGEGCQLTTHHARARERVPAEPNAIAIFDVTPLIL